MKRIWIGSRKNVQRLDCPQQSTEWFEARAGIPTVSEFSRFCTPARAAYSAQAGGYIADLIVESVQGPSEGISSYYMDRGTALEDEARSEYEFTNDVEVDVPGLILNKGAGWSPDGLVGPGAVEIKCPKPSTHVKWLLHGGLPGEHKPQCHGAILVGELAWLDFVSYCPGFPTICVRITKDDYTDKIAGSLEKFLLELEAGKRKVCGDTATRATDND